MRGCDVLESIYRSPGWRRRRSRGHDAIWRRNSPHGRRILQLLIESGALVKVHGDMYFHRDVLKDLVRKYLITPPHSQTPLSMSQL
jgi:hypothetical protein